MSLYSATKRLQTDLVDCHMLIKHTSSSGILCKVMNWNLIRFSPSSQLRPNFLGIVFIQKQQIAEKCQGTAAGLQPLLIPPFFSAWGPFTFIGVRRKYLPVKNNACTCHLELPMGN